MVPNTHTTYNPFSLEKLASYHFLDSNQLNKLLDHCETSYQQWKTSQITHRKQWGLKLFELLNNPQTQIHLSTLISNEMGKPIGESQAEIQKCAELVQYYTSNFEDFLKPDIIDPHASIHFHPTGAVLGIMPWNFPFWQVFRFAFANIMGGNIVLLKHAPNCFGCGQAIEDLFLQAGFPKHVFTNLIIPTSQTEAIIAHPVVQGVCVTGSPKAGSAVAALAGKHLKKTVLELGGSDAVVIFNDADLHHALEATFKSKMLNAGQVCIAPKRVFIHKSKLKTATDYFLTQMEKIRFGDPLNPKTTMGPISKAEFLPVLEKQVWALVSNGAELVIGGKSQAPFFEPTLLLVSPENPILKEEIFGPVLCVIPFEYEKDLDKHINKTNYGLGTAIWTQNKEKAAYWSQQIEVGHIAINSIVKSDVKYPFGGIKHSGYGKELGKEGFKTFLNAKTIVTSL